MDTHEWISRCSARLHAQWPRLPRELRDEVAGELIAQARWHDMEPEVAAAGWLGQGVLLVRNDDQGVKPSS